jgi:hypothetical protein
MDLDPGKNRAVPQQNLLNTTGTISGVDLQAGGRADVSAAGGSFCPRLQVQQIPRGVRRDQVNIHIS